MKALPLAPKQRNASDIIRLARAETSSISYGRAVAAATGRGFKSHQPDSVDGASVAVLVAKHRNRKEQAFGTNASTLLLSKLPSPMHFSTAIVSVLIGIVILFFGRKLFWLCVAAVGFAVGMEIAPLLLNEPSSLPALLIAIVFGVLGALLALFLQRVAIAVLGFLAGGKIATAIAAAFFVHYAQYSTVIFVVGGILGAILLLALFDWALIVVSSFIGAYLIESAIVLPPTGSTLVFIGLAVIGILVQTASFRKSTI